MMGYRFQGEEHGSIVLSWPQDCGVEPQPKFSLSASSPQINVATSAVIAEGGFTY